MEIKKYVTRSLPVILLLLLNTLIGLGNTSFLNKIEKSWSEKKAAPLNGGCAAPILQHVFYENLPRDIIGSQASGGYCSGNYVYQWQWSTDNVHFQDIPNANDYGLDFANSMPFAQTLGTTIYIQRRVSCGMEVQYTNSVSIIFIATVPIYARLEVHESEYNSYFGDGENEERWLYRYVSSYIRFYSDIECTIPLQLPASINCQVRACRYYEENGYVITNECSVEPWYDVTVTAGSTQFLNGELEDFEYYYMIRDSRFDPWVYAQKGWSDYELIVAENCYIMPPVYPYHLSGFGPSNQNQ
jgi:hypothetical protein